MWGRLPVCQSTADKNVCPAPLPRQLLVTDAMRLVGFLAETLLALRFIGLVIPFTPDRFAVAFKGENMRDDAVEEPAVVADDHGAAAEAQKRLFQGPQRIHVQVVGRLVEQQQVAAAAEQLGEMHAVALAAGKLTDLALLVGALEIEARDIAA